MTFLQRFFPDQAAGTGRRELVRLLAMMGLFFLVVCAVGILRPIKNALALDGLGDTDFYKVYLVSAGVVLFVPLYNKLADRVAWRWLIPSVALTFAIELVLFRMFYVEGSTAFGMFFYGWYDLFAAALVTQFFMATQLFFNARSAKQAYPLVIAGGSIGATLGGAITGFFSETVGTPNLLLVAAVLILVFSVALPLVWGKQPPARTRRYEPQGLHAGEFRALLRNRQVRLIAISVLLTVIVKQLVDYQFNTMTKEVFQDRDAISAFQGKFNAVTQWLPIVALAGLQPALKRWGVGAAVLLLPAAMLLTNIGLEIWWGLWAAVVAKGAETSLRYSTERAGREILYVPVPDEIKLKAKAYIDVAVEKGIGKVTSAGVIMLLLLFLPYRQIALFGIAFCGVWLVAAMAMRREYVRTLARSIEGRFASLRNSFASIAEASTRQAVRRALQSTDPLQIAFALDLASQAAPNDLRELAPDLNALLDHPADGVRERTLQLLARVPDLVDEPRVRERLKDEVPAIREAAIEALCAHRDPETVLAEVLHSGESAARTAALSCVARGVVPAKAARWITRDYIDHHIAQARAGDHDAKLEVALAAGVLQGERDAIQMVAELARDADTEVARAALHSAGRLNAPELYPVLLAGLGEAATRGAARASLIAQGANAAPQLAASLLDPGTPHRVRRQIPVVLTHIPTPETGRALLRSYLAPETDQLLDFRALKAMSKLRARHAELVFDRNEVGQAVRREVDAATRYETVRAAVAALEADLPGVKLLTRSLAEAWSERRECAFRLLGLVHAPGQMRDCYQSLCTGDVAVRANAIEWLEHTIEHDLFRCMLPLLREGTTTGNGRSPTAAQALASLGNDNDAWVARLAQWSAAELGLPGFHSPATGNAMDLIEKVFLLQQVDLLQGARSAQLALLASIALEQDIPANTTLIRQNEPTSALYIVIRGAVELRTTGDQVMVARDNAAFGTWALIDQAPSMLSARTVEPTRVLCIERDDLDDLLNENPELALGLLQGLARRVRTLVA